MSTQLAVGRSRARLVREVGSGVTSTVWLATDETSGVELAVKFAREPGFRSRLAEEAQRLWLVESPTLTGLVGAGVTDETLTGEGNDARAIPAGTAWVALEWAEGVALDVAVDRRPADRLALALAVARDVARALGDLHALGVAHGDVKPANVVVQRSARSNKRDGRWTATLVDLGLAATAKERTPRGGTPRYLPPEVWHGDARGDGRARDLWALGVTLAEIVDARVAAAERPFDVFDVARLPPELADLVRAVLAPAPGARPDADWVWRAALDALGQSEAAAEARQRREAAVRRAYLAGRERELGMAACAGDVRIRADGAPAVWLGDALERARGIARLLGQPTGLPAYTLDDLDPAGKKQWLVRLVGSVAAEWPAPSSSDARLAERLLGFVETSEPTSLSLSELETGSKAELPRLDDPIELCLALLESPVAPAVLDAAEALVRSGRAPERLALLLASRLRLAAQFGRALAVLARAESSACRVQRAEIARRAGATAWAEELLSQLDRSRCTADEWARRSATLGRVALDHGDVRAAFVLCAEHDTSVPALETRALAEIARADHGAAAKTIERGRLLCRDDEERARMEAVRGVLAGARGDAENELQAFARAAEFASRAGAVLEEATYLTGVAAAATQVGDLTRALEASERAILLFDHLRRSAHAARAAQARVAVFAHAGAVERARSAADVALALARASGDKRCRAYVHMSLADVLPRGDRTAADHAERAAQLLGTSDPDDWLRAAARQLGRGNAVDVGALDALGRDPARALDARLDWWGARARALMERDGAGDATRGDAVVAELVALASVRAPAAIRGVAFAAGAELGAAIGDGDAARRLTLAAGDAARELLSRAGDALSVAVEALDWVTRARAPRSSTVAPEQLADIETLVRALGRRDRLRPLLDRVLDALVLWTGVERGLLLLRAPGERLVPRAARNLAHADLTGAQLALSHSLAERALAQREPVVAVDAAGDLPEIHESVHALKLRSVLAVPLIAHGETLGVVYLDDRVRRGAFGPPELAWVRIVAALAAVAIADARDQLLLRRAARRAQRAEARLAGELARREAELDQARGELARAREGRETRFAYDAIVGQSAPIREMLRVVDRVAASEVPVLIFGESGSGKELVARAIHDNGPRARRPFVTENCSAIPEGLLESTLFGHVRGAFTGASRPRAGLFEIADGGTLFLDEIAEMSLAMQSKLLRVLEDGVLRPVGSESERRVDVRVIGATHRVMDELVESGRFRRDLFYRLNVISVRAPALRDRQADIPLLVRHFVELHAKGRAVSVSRAAMEHLVHYAWPGNVRQLENEVRRALVLADGAIEPSHLSPEVRERASSEARHLGLNVRERVDALEAELVQMALGRTGGNQTRAAELLGLSRFGLQKMLRRLGIEPLVAMTSVSR